MDAVPKALHDTFKILPGDRDVHSMAHAPPRFATSH